MKSTGMVRKVDQLGRIVLPAEIRRVLEIISDETELEIYVDGQDIILRKFEYSCIFCGETSDLVKYKGKKVCKECLEGMRK